MTDQTDAVSLLNLEQVAEVLAKRSGASVDQVAAAIKLLDEGSTLPFIARYRKEVTRGLDETALRIVQDGLHDARDLADRKGTVLRTIDSQGQLTHELRRQILQCDDQRQLEDLYLPFKPQRRSRATAARERGLGPLADLLLAQQRLTKSPEVVVDEFVSDENDVPNREAAILGACDIVAEVWSQEAQVRQWMSEQADRGHIVCRVKRGKKDEGSRFEAYFDHRERIDRLASHRFLAMQRGVNEGVLRMELSLDEETVTSQLMRRFIRNPDFAFADVLRTTVLDCYRRILLPAADSGLMQKLKRKADEEAIGVFASNLREVLMAAPAGPRVTMGIDPGFRTGCKVVVVDGTGKYLTNKTVFPTPPRSDKQAATQQLLELIETYHVEMIAIGNGTASRETDAFVSDLITQRDLQVTKAIVSESGASIYSASELAVREYPELDVTVRGAISIAHRLQDPLAALVKIDPKSIGVGQYQHDVNQTALQKSLDREVESCVNTVGVDLNLASASLLRHVAGIGETLAARIVDYRNSNGRFSARRELLKVPRLGAKAFEQAAGFLRIRDGGHPLDNSAVHPESYDVAECMARKAGISVAELIGNAQAIAQLNAADFVSEDVGEFTVCDILQELSKPGRDPREEFRAVRFAVGVNEVSDLRIGMALEGVVTNVTHFGAFVDVGVHQDGLIHISQLADHFVQNPAVEVSVGEIVNVHVLDVDEKRGRISLSRKTRASNA